VLGVLYSSFQRVRSGTNWDLSGGAECFNVSLTSYAIVHMLYAVRSLRRSRMAYAVEKKEAAYAIQYIIQSV
jgi:hypothetical protein